ncbi:bilin reductase [Clostridium sp. VAP41]|uniref:bilin reductase n=1 Tax=Clostridium sp. VAP41 TaxID=2949979 RepID=UPI00207A31EF|nr:bilin reductase [Clostridium sp. VAP41]
MSKTDNENIFDINKEIIEQHIKRGMDLLTSSYDLKEVETGKFSNLQIQGIDYNIKQYEINGVGNLLVMDSKDSIKLQMASFVLTPYYKSLPLFSTDYIYMNEKRNFLIEYYDLVPEKDELYLNYMNKFANLKAEHNQLEDMTLKECWYDSLKPVCTAKKADRAEDSEISSMFVDNLQLFIEMDKNSELLTTEERKLKWKITQDYTDGLVDNGGVSTNVFKAIIGSDATKEFFNNVFFGTSRYANC